MTRFEAEFDLDFHRRVRDGFLALAVESPSQFVVVDASLPADDVAAAAANAVDRMLRAGEPKPPLQRTIT